MFRSEDVSLYEIKINPESLWDFLNCLGMTKNIMIGGQAREMVLDKGAISQFRDADNLQNMINYITDKCKFFELPEPKRARNPTEI